MKQYDILAQQNRVTKEFVSQQQRNSLPKRDVPVFSYNPLEYCTLIRAVFVIRLSQLTLLRRNSSFEMEVILSLNVPASP